MKTLGLCVGINNFKFFPDSKLNGCVNDSRNFVEFIKKTYKDPQIVSLVDKAATRNNILSSLNKIVYVANTDKLVSRIWFTMSSHGSQQPGGSDEWNDEVFICHDSDLDGSYFVNAIVDDDLHRILSQVRKSCLVEVFLDTCHSGTGVRLMNTAIKPRSIINPAAKITLPLRSHKQPENVILWAACKDSQTANDAYFDDSYQGAASWSWLHVANNQSKRSIILKNTQTLLDINEMSQTMQLECARKYKSLMLME